MISMMDQGTVPRSTGLAVKSRKTAKTAGSEWNKEPSPGSFFKSVENCSDCRIRVEQGTVPWVHFLSTL